MMTLTFHQSVMTPNGAGIVQGLLHKPGEPDRIIVSHKWDDAQRAGLPVSYVRGVWHLCHYDIDDLTEAR